MNTILEILSHITESPGQTVTVFFYALLGGFVPALFWLWFWLHEKQKHNEPRRVIAKVFLLGMLAVFLSYVIQTSIGIRLIGAEGDPILLLIHVIVEEFLKFGAAYVVAFRTKVFDEPIDAFVYLMTAAVGFAAMENTLYLIQPLLAGETLQTIVTGYMRFIGSSILHVTSSGALSVCIGLSFCKSPLIKELWIWGGLTIACAIHLAFNVFLTIRDGSSAFLVFSSIWITAIGLILLLEKVKQNKCF